MPRKPSNLTTPQANDIARHFLGPDWQARGYLSGGEKCYAVFNPTIGSRFLGPTWRTAFRRAGVWQLLKPRPQFTAHEDRLMDGEICVGVLYSRNFAIRTANALNAYEPDRRGL